MHDERQPQSSTSNVSGTNGGRGFAANPIDRIVAEHKLQLELCDALEFIADGLPDSVDRRLVRQVTAILERGLSPHFRVEEQFLFPMLRRLGARDPSLLAALDQLELEHLRDDDISSELLDELQILAETGQVRNADMLGYMLRFFFEGQRRHIAWENSVVVPAARRLLGETELQELMSRQQAFPDRLWQISGVKPARA